MIAIRKANELDQDAVWQIISEVIKKGDTYVFDANSTKDEMLNYWFASGVHTYVATQYDIVVGTFIIKNNQPGRGSHIANASYMVAEAAFGNGIGQTMGEFSLLEAKSMGYLAIQFNIVIKTNERAWKLWQKLGFNIIGEVPNAFMHQTLGLTNAYIMHKKL
jgi:ribosomal protein S18 acetylase RimI-like enzyme